MRSYVSFVFTAEDQHVIRQLERLLKKVGIACEYSEFKPAIPQLKPTFSVVVRTDPGLAEQFRGRLTMVLSVLPGRRRVDMTECVVEPRRQVTP